MIYLGNGLYSDSGSSLAHYGVRGMRWASDKRKTSIDWSDPEEVQKYYAETVGRVPRQVANRLNIYNSRVANAGRRTSNNAASIIGKAQPIGRYASDIARSRNGESRNFVRPSYRKAQAEEDKSREPKGGRVPIRENGSFVTPRSPRDIKNRADEEKAPRGGFVTPRSSAERRAADDRAHGPRGGFVAPRPGYVIRDQEDKKRGPKGGPHFATKEYQQEQLNKRLHKDSQKAENKAYHDQIARQQGTLYEAVAGGGLMRRRNINGPYESKEAMKEAARRTNASAQAGIEAGRRRAQNKKTEERNLNAGIAAGRERRRNAENAKRGVESKSAHNQAVKNQENKRGSGTLADYNYQKRMDNNEKRKVADYMRGNKKSYFDLDLGKRNTENGITAGRNRATLKKAEDAYNKKLAEEKAKKKANSPYNKTKNAFVKGSEDIVGSAYDAYKKGKKKLKKFFG